MDLATLQNEARQSLDDPSGDVYTPERLTRLINKAYRKAVQEVEKLNKHYNVFATPITVNVTEAEREYALSVPNGADEIRYILDVQRTDLATKVPMTFTTFSQRDESLGTIHVYFRSVASSDVYVYRVSGGSWKLGLSDNTPSAMTLAVWFTPSVRALVNPSDVPTMVPVDHHDLIVYGACAMGKIEENRDARGFQSLMAMAIEDLRVTLDGSAFTSRCRPF